MTNLLYQDRRKRTLLLLKGVKSDADDTEIGGFEIENSRISDLPDMEFTQDGALPTHKDIRDDRINLYVNAERKAQDYFYLVRAVSPGTYRMGPVSADAMYNNEYYSAHGGGTITINKAM